MSTPESDFNDMLSKGLASTGPSWIEKAIKQHKNIPLGVCNSIPLKLKEYRNMIIYVPENKCTQN